VQQYRLALEQHGVDAEQVDSVPLIAPEDVHVQTIWKQFVQDILSFVPSTDDADLPAWQAFLERRYEKIENLNRAYQVNYTEFDNVPLPNTLPPDGPALLDWYQFQAIVLTMRNAAHQFTVLLPVPKTANAEDYQHQLELAQRLIELEKPAHTTFEVKFYLAVFRIGVARLGVDTLVDLGSRTPQLMAPMILGQSSLLESYLASEQTLDVTHRAVLKREQAS
jgi:hypothetical protein